MTKRTNKINKSLNKIGSDQNSNLDIMGPKSDKKLKQKVARTKWDVYSCPSLRIAKNQE